METILGIIASAILGAIVTYFFTSRKKLMIILNTKAFSFKDYKIPDLKITYKDNTINDFCVSNVIIRNCGNKTIDRNDIAKNDRLNIKLMGSFSAYKLAEQNKANNVAIELIEPNKYSIGFDYLDKKDQINIMFYHDHAKLKPIISGKIKGCRLVLSTTRHPFSNNVGNLISGVISLSVPAILVYSVFKATEPPTILDIILPLAVVLVFCVGGGYMIYNNLKEIINTYRINRKLNTKQ